MTLNPCCIPLKTGVRMVTHLSMALAICVGWSALKMMSISLEVTSELSNASPTPPTRLYPDRVPINQNRQSQSQLETGVAVPPVYPSHNYRNPYPIPPNSGGGDPYRIPYEYILFHNWHQQQQQLRHHHNLDNINSPQSSHNQEQQQRRIYGRPLSPPMPLPATPSVYVENGNREDESMDDEEMNKFFRSVMHQRKNFKAIPGSDPTSRNPDVDDRDRNEARMTSLPTPSPLVGFVVQGRRRSEEESRKVKAKDWSSPYSPDDGDDDDDDDEDDHHHHFPAHLSPLKREEQEIGQHGNSQRDRVRVSLGSGSNEQRNALKRKKMNRTRDPDFREEYAKVLLVCGLLALCTVIFQFFTSFLLLCFVDKGSNAAAQIWTAVNCSVVFCLATCLVLFLCEGLSIQKYVFDETLYLSLVTVDSLLSIYFLWVVMAFI